MIESLHSSHVARVKALSGSKGARERKQSGLFVAEGAQCLKEAVTGSPTIETLYLTEQGRCRVDESALDISQVNVVDVSDAVMEAMTSTITPQGILALCYLPQQNRPLPRFRTAIYLYEIQDPGNAGTILRSADAMGIDVVITSPGSVDMYSPKVVRATAGSLWHINLFEEIEFSELKESHPHHRFIALSADADSSLSQVELAGDVIAVFGNEARGVSAEVMKECEGVYIPMSGRAESLNLSAAAAIVMHQMAQA